jgi:hypothetical protein
LTCPLLIVFPQPVFGNHHYCCLDFNYFRFHEQVTRCSTYFLCLTYL